MQKIFLLSLLLQFFILSLAAQAKIKKCSLLPDHTKLQFAGAIGFVSIGFGYESKNHKLQEDIYYGYVPKKLGGVTIHSLTAKLSWTPVSCFLKKNIRADVFTSGLLINYAFGKQYFAFSPENYPYSYYGFPTAIHLSIFAGGGLHIKKAGLYYEIGTTDYELLSFIQNARSLRFTDILNMGIGVRYSFHSYAN